MSDVPLTDWDLISRWELFHASAAGGDGASEAEGGAALGVFAELAKVINASVVLDACCGSGAGVLQLTRNGINAIGCDKAASAARYADAFLKQQQVPGGAFQSSVQDLPERIPHRFDAILCSDLSCEADYKKLQSALSGIFGALKPGGFLMFSGAPEGSGADWAQTLLQKYTADPEEERIEWFTRKDRTTCAKIVRTSAAADYVDRRFLYAIDEDGTSRLESTTIRIPCYWTWEHWKELCDNAGFCHVETRDVEGGATVNVAWKAGGNIDAIDFEARAKPYLD